MSAQPLIEDLREISTSERDKGKLFEKLIAAFFKLAPQYSEILSDVWLWGEWPLNELLSNLVYNRLGRTL